MEYVQLQLASELPGNPASNTRRGVQLCNDDARPPGQAGRGGDESAHGGARRREHAAGGVSTKKAATPEEGGSRNGNGELNHQSERSGGT